MGRSSHLVVVQCNEGKDARKAVELVMKTQTTFMITKTKLHPDRTLMHMI